MYYILETRWKNVIAKMQISVKGNLCFIEFRVYDVIMQDAYMEEGTLLWMVEW